MASTQSNGQESQFQSRDVCASTASVANRPTGSNQEIIRTVLDGCATSCRVCGLECERHASMPAHCRICGEACRDRERACRHALESMAVSR